MFKNEQLKKMTLDQLKEIADKEKLQYKKSFKKDDFIKLILNLKTESKTKEKGVDIKINGKKVISKSKKAVKKVEKVKINNAIDNIPDLPKVYGKNKIVLLIKDPYNGFAYWDINEDEKKKHNMDNQNINKYLKVYDITDSNNPDNPTSTFDIRINETIKSWYIKFPKPNRTYIIDLGYYKDNKFITVLRSNSISLPRIDVSEEIDTEWKLTEEQFEQVMKASGADVMFQHDGSQELMKFLSGNLEENYSSR